MVIIGLSVDAAGQLRTLMRADNVAAEAARAAGQAIDREQAFRGEAVRVDPDAAVAAAEQYLRDAGATDWMITVLPDRQHVQVTATLVYRPLILGALGFGDRQVTATATANLITQ